MRNYKLERLQGGETFVTSEKGNSMVPLIKSGQEHILGKVKGNFYTHLVKAKNNEKGLLIGNNKGGINGWTKQVYGRVIEIV
jgi:hypothetical protein